MRIYLHFHLPGLGHELVPSDYSSPKYVMRREPFPVNPRHLITDLWKFRLRLISHRLLPIFLTLLLPSIGDIIAGIRVGVLVRVEGRLCRWWIKLTDPGDTPGDLSWGVDLVPGLAGRFVDEGRSEGRVSRELECTTAHCGLVGGRGNQQRQSDGHIRDLGLSSRWCPLFPTA